MSSTYNPIQACETASRRLFQQRQAPTPGVALVVHREGRPLLLLERQTDRLTAGEAWWGGIKAIYRVDVSDHKLEFACELPCEGHAFTFTARLQFTCRVRNAVTVVERGITDATETLEKVLADAMRDVSRHYRVDQADAAELAIRAALVERERAEGFSPAFRISDVAVQLQLEEGAREHVRRIKDEDRAHERTLQGLIRQKEVEISRASVEAERDRLKGERAKLLADLDRTRLQEEAEVERTQLRLSGEIDQWRASAEVERRRREIQTEAELQRQRDELEIERDKLQGERNQILAELELAKVAREGELQFERARIEAEIKRRDAALQVDLRRQEHNLELERLRLYTDHYAPLIERGDWGLLAAQLAQSSDPDAIANVVRMVREQRDADLDRQLDTLRLLLEQDALEGAQIAQIASEGKQLLERLIRSWGRSDKPEVLPPSPRTRGEGGDRGEDEGGEQAGRTSAVEEPAEVEAAALDGKHEEEERDVSDAAG